MKLSKLYKLFFLILSVTFVNAEENYLNIDAAHFESNEKKNIIHFKGDVKMIKHKDILLCQDLLINMQDQNGSSTKQIPKDYKASGDVSFTINTEDNILKGRGDTVLYYPIEQKYIIIGNGYLEDLKEGKKLIASKIYIDEKTGHTKIDGEKNKPVKFRLKLSKEEN